MEPQTQGLAVVVLVVVAVGAVELEVLADLELSLLDTLERKGLLVEQLLLPVVIPSTHLLLQGHL
jgi:ABC-type transport system involved in cytochrome c biogenesis permease component